MLDEGIDLIVSLWAGRLRSNGRHYPVDLAGREDLPRMARPVQHPRIRICVVGAWPRPKSLRCVLRCDAVLPVCMDARGFRATTPDDIRAMRRWFDAHGGVRPGVDVVMEGEMPADTVTAASIVAPWEGAGCT